MSTFTANQPVGSHGSVLVGCTHDGMQRWNRLWRYPLFRRAPYLITAVWAAVYVLEALGKAYIVHSAGFTAAYTWTQILPPPPRPGS